jgi:hypothetical protein
LVKRSTLVSNAYAVRAKKSLYLKYRISRTSAESHSKTFSRPCTRMLTMVRDLQSQPKAKVDKNRIEQGSGWIESMKSMISKSLNVTGEGHCRG